MEKFNTNKNIILGSKSPRRIELLKLMGLNIQVRKLDIDESYPKSLSPIQTALFLSRKKANAYVISNQDILICADTIVYIKNLILEKPKNKIEAQKMLEKLSNRRHFVVTGVTIKTSNNEISFYERSLVVFKKISQKEIQFYIQNYNPLDKAGGYGIQDWIGLIGIKKISGSYYNVMGLPTSKLYEELNKLVD
ncbi:MAG: septum formation protein Maf [Flavobacteriales bacterium]|nr:septum formation protein Maf [Flavobacteriales bacterium]